MTYSYIVLVSTAAAIDTVHVSHIFRDVIFLLILLSGIGMALTIDQHRHDVKKQFSLGYAIFSISASVFFSFLSIAAYIEFDFNKFYFYLLIGLTASLAPQFARKVLPEAPEQLKDGLFSLFKSFINGLANKLNDSNNDTK